MRGLNSHTGLEGVCTEQVSVAILLDSFITARGEVEEAKREHHDPLFGSDRSKHWSKAGQTRVKHGSNTGQTRVKTLFCGPSPRLGQVRRGS